MLPPGCTGWQNDGYVQASEVSNHTMWPWQGHAKVIHHIHRVGPASCAHCQKQIVWNIVVLSRVVACMASRVAQESHCILVTSFHQDCPTDTYEFQVMIGLQSPDLHDIVIPLQECVAHQGTCPIWNGHILILRWQCIRTDHLFVTNFNWMSWWLRHVNKQLFHTCQCHTNPFDKKIVWMLTEKWLAPVPSVLKQLSNLSSR